MSNMILALQITGLGMGLVFGAIILLWGVMNVLTSLTADKSSLPVNAGHGSDPVESTPVVDSEFKARAAAIAVAMALAEQQASSAHPLREPPTAVVSPWQLGMRSRQLYQKGPVRRPRKIG